MKRVVVLLAAAWALAGLGGCGSAPTRVGDVCQSDDHCGGKEDNLQLVCDHSIPGGSCTVGGCISDKPETPEPEDLQSCPEGSRCVREGVDITVCRRSCRQQSDCREVITCGKTCVTENGVETCHQECKNGMQCTPFWDLTADQLKAYSNPPRACILSGMLYQTSGD